MDDGQDGDECLCYFVFVWQDVEFYDNIMKFVGNVLIQEILVFQYMYFYLFCLMFYWCVMEEVLGEYWVLMVVFEVGDFDVVVQVMWMYIECLCDCLLFVFD